VLRGTDIAVKFGIAREGAGLRIVAVLDWMLEDVKTIELLGKLESLEMLWAKFTLCLCLE
jgi:hypothetical protein